MEKVFRSTNKKVRALIVGDGEEREHIEEFATSLKIGFTTEKDSVHDKPLIFTSWVKEVDVVTAGLDIVVLTSLNEGTPVSLIEAQAANRPIVSTRVGGIEDVVTEGETAFLSDKLDITSFIRHVIQLVEDDELRVQLGKDSGKHVRQLYSHNRLVKDMHGLYDNLLNGK